MLVDVREPFEKAIADLPEMGQLRIPLRDLPGRIHELPRDADLVLYCRSGSRSAMAVAALVQRGFPRVWNLEGGLLRWRDEVDPSLTAY